MKEIITYSAQYKVIPQNITEQPTQNQNQNHTKNTNWRFYQCNVKAMQYKQLAWTKIWFQWLSG